MPAQPAHQPTIAAPLVNQTTFMGVVWGGTVVATLALAFRYYVRIKCFRRLLPDDFITGFAWVLLLATAITWQIIIPDMYEVTGVGSGLRMPSANFVTNFNRYMKGEMSILIIFYFGLWAIKLNFLVFFYRLGSQVAYYRKAWWAVTIFTMATFIQCIGTIQYPCLSNSFEYITANCTGEAAIRFQNITLKFNCAVDVLTDMLIMLLPISILWNVRISLARRLALAGVFSLVIITMIVAVIRVAIVTEAAASNHKSKQVEMTWLFMWHFIESSVALLVACLASFRALFATKERSREVEGARKREIEGNENQHHNLKAIRARAKHFQDSLFETMKDSNKSSQGSIIGKAHRLGSCDSSHDQEGVSRVDSHGMDHIPALNSHGLIEIPGIVNGVGKDHSSSEDKPAY